MIGSLRGRVLLIEGMTVLIECSQGVGYEIEVPASAFDNIKLNDNAFLYIHHVVREDADLLYGFVSLSQRKLFRELIKINGIGPKLVMAILSTMSVDDFISAVSMGRTALLTQVPGIGKKTAERIIIEIKDKLDKLNLSNEPSNDKASGKVGQVQNTKIDNNVFEESISALISLGYKENVAISTVKAVYDESLDTQGVIVKALSYIRGLR